MLALLADAFTKAMVGQLPTLVGWVETAIARGRQAQAAADKQAADEAAINRYIADANRKP